MSPRTALTLVVSLVVASSALVAVSAASEPGRMATPDRVERSAVTPRPATVARAAPGARPRGSVTLRFASYNIHFGASGIDRVADDIARLDADVVLLNEADVDDRPGGVHQGRALARALGMDLVYDANVYFPRARRGNAVLTRLDVVDLRRYDLFSNPGQRPRGLMRVRLATDGMLLDTWVTHLHPTSGTLRQARDVQALIGEPTCATVVGGDLNADDTDREHAVMSTHLRDVWGSVGTGDGDTNYAHDRRIDYLFTAHATPVRSRVTPLRHSDHRAVVGVVRMARADGC